MKLIDKQIMMEDSCWAAALAADDAADDARDAASLWDAAWAVYSEDALAARSAARTALDAALAARSAAWSALAARDADLAALDAARHPYKSSKF